ncbi:MAG: hypothetical protein CMH11_05280 [Maritimibacter sp.]|nr:hypothetical protein [Maritimibacter sp.]
MRPSMTAPAALLRGVGVSAPCVHRPVAGSKMSTRAESRWPPNRRASGPDGTRPPITKILPSTTAVTCSARGTGREGASRRAPVAMSKTCTSLTARHSGGVPENPPMA